MADAGSIWISLRLKTDEFTQGIDKAKVKLTGWRDETNKGVQDLTKWGTALTATIGPVIAAGTAVYALQQKYGAMADQILDLSASTDVGVEKIQQMQRAAILSNTNFGSVELGLNRLSLSIEAAGDKSSGAAQAFAKMGIDPTGKSLDQVFEETATALMGMENTTDRNAAAMAIYGKQWSELIPYMETYIEKKKEIQSSPTFSKQELKDLEDAKVAWDDLGNSVTIYTGKGIVAVQQGVDLLAAMSPIISGNGKQFLENAQTYRQEQIQKEQQKLKDLLAENAKASSPGVDTAPGNWAASLFGGESEGKQKSAVDYLDAISDAMKKQKDAVKDLADEKKKLADIEKNYYDDIEFAGRDMSQIRSLTRNWNKETTSQKKSIAAAQGKVGEASAAVGKAGGDLVLYINGSQTPVTVPGIVNNTSGISNADLMAKGIRKVA